MTTMTVWLRLAKTWSIRNLSLFYVWTFKNDTVSFLLTWKEKNQQSAVSSPKIRDVQWAQDRTAKFRILLTYRQQGITIFEHSFPPTPNGKKSQLLQNPDWNLLR